MRSIIADIIGFSQKAIKIEFLDLTNRRHVVWVPRSCADYLGGNILLDAAFLENLESRLNCKLMRGKKWN